ncbi:MAG: ketopantoate reductase family protein, partial [Hydrogenophaga sp.]
MTTPLNIAVMGAGAVGCYYGGMLARAGHRVTLIGRPSHVQALQADGLRMQTLSFDEHVPVAASTTASAARNDGVTTSFRRRNNGRPASATSTAA